MPCNAPHRASLEEGRLLMPLLSRTLSQPDVPASTAAHAWTTRLSPDVPDAPPEELEEAEVDEPEEAEEGQAGSPPSRSSKRQRR